MNGKGLGESVRGQFEAVSGGCLERLSTTTKGQCTTRTIIREQELHGCWLRVVFVYTCARGCRPVASHAGHTGASRATQNKVHWAILNIRRHSTKLCTPDSRSLMYNLYNKIYLKFAHLIAGDTTMTAVTFITVDIYIHTYTHTYMHT
jgi:hypothetical protein